MCAACEMTPRKTWLIASAVFAVAVYALLWIGYASQWHWVTITDSSLLEIGHRHGVAHPGWVIAWNVFCAVLGPSDVLAGWALGYAYFVACLLLVPPSRPVTVTDETPAAPGTAR
jgi:membrane-associated phospholipid phosphatase